MIRFLLCICLALIFALQSDAHERFSRGRFVRERGVIVRAPGVFIEAPRRVPPRVFIPARAPVYQAPRVFIPAGAPAHCPDFQAFAGVPY